MAQERIRAQDAVEVRIVSRRKAQCPFCRATRFHRADFLEIDEGGEEVVAFSEYRCVNCNRSYQKDSLLGQL